MSSRLRTALVPAVAIVLALAGCAAEGPVQVPVGDPATPAEPGSPQPSTRPDGTGVDGAPAATPSGAPSPEPTGERAPDPTYASAEELGIDRTIDAGTVNDGEPVVLSDTGSAVIDFALPDDRALIAEVDCTTCTGEVLVTSTGRTQPWGVIAPSDTASYLLSITRGSGDEDLIIDTEGNWTVTLMSWVDLGYVHGPQSGTGSTVLALGDEISRFEFSYSPGTSGETVQVRVYSDVVTTDIGAASVLFGGDEEFTDTYELELPGVFAIMTDTGSWTITPLD